MWVFFFFFLFSETKSNVVHHRPLVHHTAEDDLQFLIFPRSPPAQVLGMAGVCHCAQAFLAVLTEVMLPKKI